MKSNIFALSFVLFGMLVLAAQAEPEPEPAPAPAPEPAKARFMANPKFRSAELRQVADVVADENDDAEDAVNDKTSAKPDASSGRLFLKKFLLFKNIFGNQQQPIIPIIITGPSGAAGTNPTTTITSTGTIPTATGTITTSPASPTSPTSPSPDLRSGPGYNSQDEEELEQGEAEDAAVEEVAAMDEQALPSELIAGAQEYIVTDEEIKGTADGGKAQPNRINLRRKGGKKAQRISVRIPPQYRRYFKPGQRVMLNAGDKRPAKRRVVKKRVNKNNNNNNKKRRRVNKNRNKNKRTRIVAA